jgi:diadenosine tetraphosphate (Ap4A) HIT family hydrolase
MPNPFAVETEKPLVAIKGARCGYLQLSCTRESTHYDEMPDALLLAAKAWAAELERQGARRVYWITLSEVVRQLHIHLYPRWRNDEPKGLVLFGERETAAQPDWTEAVNEALERWAERHQVEIIAS